MGPLKNRLLLFLAITTFFGITVPAARAYTESRSREPTPGFVDNAPVRGMKHDEILSAVSELRYGGDDYISLPAESSMVKYSVETQQGFVYTLFINEYDGAYPLYSPGSYIIKRSLEDGTFIQIKIFYAPEAGSFVRVFPNRDRALMDVYLLGRRVYRGLNLPLPFEEYLSASFEEILRTTASVVDWSLLMPKPGKESYAALRSMIDTIRAHVPDMPDADDGALDADGRWIAIETGEPLEQGGFNCSGFAKWVVDGIYGPMAGEFLRVKDLKNRPTDVRGNRWSDRYEHERDPYFGLDWTRNLAMAVAGARHLEYDNPETFDVISKRVAVYREDIGYAMEDLPLVLQEQAVHNPGYFYLASVNGIYGSDPPLRQHYHVALFFPYIQANGTLKVVVFERGRETPYDSFQARYPGEFIHLVRLRAPETFTPPDIPPK